MSKNLICRLFLLAVGPTLAPYTLTRKRATRRMKSAGGSP